MSASLVANFHIPDLVHIEQPAPLFAAIIHQPPHELPAFPVVMIDKYLDGAPLASPNADR